MEEGTPRRIAVVGSPGAGKSVLVTAIAAATGLPLIHLDREHWRAGWVEPDEAAWQATNARLVAGERWVIDGNYSSTLATRLARATLVIWLDLPIAPCMIGAVRRMLRYRQGGRPDMADGCPERFDREYLSFLYYIATFRRRKRDGIARAIAAGATPVVRIASVRQRRRFGRALAAGGLLAAMTMPS